MLYKLYLYIRDTIRQFPAVHRIVWRARKAIWSLQNLGQPQRPIVEAGPILIEAISTGRPLAAGKIGFTELLGLNHYLKRKAAISKNREPAPYPPYTSDTLFINSGVFPQQDKLFDRFANIFYDRLGEMDVLASWGLNGETYMFNTAAPSATLVRRVSLEPYLSDNSWTSALEGKRVLVISPFIDTVRQQYSRRTEIWKDQRMLPAFTLETIRAPFSAGLVTPKHLDWMEALADLEGQMDALEYDVALVGAGAFSLPLATHAKRRGKVGVHMGGSLQLAFGIYGNRWKDDKEFQRFFNDSWVRPSKEETPEFVHKNENAAYW